MSHFQRPRVRRLDGLVWRRIVFHSLLAGLLVSGGVAVSWQTDVNPPVAGGDAPLFTPGPGSVGAAASLETPARVPDLGSSARRGWSGGGILDLEALGSGRSTAGQANAASLEGTEFEDADDLPRAAGLVRNGTVSIGNPGPANTRQPNTGSSIVAVASGRPREGGSATPDRWADRRGGVTPAGSEQPAGSAPTAADVGHDCGWLGLGCASRGIWMAIGGLGATGIALAALIARELYFGR